MANRSPPRTSRPRSRSIGGDPRQHADALPLESFGHRPVRRSHRRRHPEPVARRRRPALARVADHGTADDRTGARRRRVALGRRQAAGVPTTSEQTRVYVQALSPDGRPDRPTRRRHRGRCRGVRFGPCPTTAAVSPTSSGVRAARDTRSESRTWTPGRTRLLDEDVSAAGGDSAGRLTTRPSCTSRSGRSEAERPRRPNWCGTSRVAVRRCSCRGARGLSSVTDGNRRDTNFWDRSSTSRGRPVRLRSGRWLATPR